VGVLRAKLAVAAGLILGALPCQAQDPPDPRRDLQILEHALDLSVRKVSRASAAHVLGVGESCRGYHLKGYGAVFVLSPRILPSRNTQMVVFSSSAGQGLDIEQALGVMEESLKHVESEDVRNQMQRTLAALRQQMEAGQARREAPPAPPGRRQPEPEHPATSQEAPAAPGRAVSERERDLRTVEAQAQALQQEAERAQQEHEKAFNELEQRVRSRGAVPVSQGDIVGGGSVVAPPVIAPPPWSFWFDASDERDPRTAEAVIGDVRAAVTQTIELQGTRLRVLQPEEFVVVAVDFLPRSNFGVRWRPSRTLVVRARKKELDERQAGRITSEELRRRIDYQEY